MRRQIVHRYTNRSTRKNAYDEITSGAAGICSVTEPVTGRKPSWPGCASSETDDIANSAMDRHAHKTRRNMINPRERDTCDPARHAWPRGARARRAEALPVIEKRRYSTEQDPRRRETPCRASASP